MAMDDFEMDKDAEAFSSETPDALEKGEAGSVEHLEDILTGDDALLNPGEDEHSQNPGGEEKGPGQYDVLIVEDSHTQALKLQMLLEQQGYRVTTAVNGEEGLDMAHKLKPDIIISDVQMPRMRGDEMCEAIKKDKALRHIPVILLTTLNDAEDIITGLKVGADTYVTKPYNGYFLLNKVDSHLSSPVRPEGPIIEEAQTFVFKGKQHSIILRPAQMLTLLLSIYEDSVLKNYELMETEKALDEVNKDLKKRIMEKTVAEKALGELTDQLEDEVAERTAGLRKEIAVREAAEEESLLLVQKIQKAMKDTATPIAALLKIRDPSTSIHQEKVCQLAVAIAKQMGLHGKDMDGLIMASRIHDLGMIGIPLEVLNKPMVFTPAEFSLVQTHAQVGYDIMSPVAFPWAIADIILQHHERLDGSGYPRGLSGNSILLEARILSVADVVEAMVSDRPHRRALGVDAAMNEITQGKDILYDTHVVDACVEIVTRKNFQFS